MTGKEQEQWKQKYVEPLLFDQRASLEEWLDHFLSIESQGIPDALKYWIFRGVVGLQEYEKQEGGTIIEFPRRSKGSVKKFPDLNHEAIAYVSDAMETKLAGKAYELPLELAEGLTPDEKKEFYAHLARENFGKLYAWMCQRIRPIPEHLLPITAGEWKVYPKGSQFEHVAKTLRGRGTGLCIAGRGAAQRYLETGDLLVYYSQDEEDEATLPRAAVHVVDNKIVEARGIAYKQNVDGYIADTVQAKLNEFPNGKEYQKKTADMKRLTEVDIKAKKGIELTDDDLVFLYERDSTIQYFGQRADPRIKELREKRNAREDAPRVLDCDPSQIAWSQEEFLKNPEHFKAYIGPLFDGIFQEYPNIEYIYTSFPERQIIRFENTVSEHDLKNGHEFKRAITDEGMGVWGEYLLTTGMTKDGETFDDLIQKRREEVKKRGGKETITFVRLTVNDLFGDNRNHTVKEIFDKAHDLGLEDCPVETGPLLRLALGNDQPMRTYWSIAHEPITASGGKPSVFDLRHDDGGVGLGRWAGPVGGWDPDSEVVFCLRK